MNAEWQMGARWAKERAKAIAMRTGKVVIGKWDDDKNDFVLFCEGKPIPDDEPPEEKNDDER